MSFSKESIADKELGKFLLSFWYGFESIFSGNTL